MTQEAALVLIAELQAQNALLQAEKAMLGERVAILEQRIADLEGGTRPPPPWVKANRPVREQQTGARRRAR